MTNDNFSNAFLEWQNDFETKLKRPQDPFSPEVNVYYLDIADHTGEKNF
jgi:hypothetical protein